jgi:phage terminase large subunit-like protein
MPLDPWQEWLVIHAGELLKDGRPRFRTVVSCLARQNGKTTLLVVLTLFWLFHEKHPMVLSTSTKLDTAKESWKRAVRLTESTPELMRRVPRKGGIKWAMGGEELETTDGCRYKIAAANATGGRGLTIWDLVLDELQEHDTWEAYNAAVPATSAVREAQIFAIATMGREKSVVLQALRQQALDGTDERLGLFEWSSPDGMAATDVKALAMANPNLGRRIELDSLMGQAKRAEKARGEQLSSFLREYHCRYVAMANPAIDAAAWADCKGDASLDAFRDSVAMCLDVSLDEHHAALYAAAVDGDTVRVDAVQAWEGVNAVHDMTAALPDLITRAQPLVLGWFPNGPAAAAAAALTERIDWPPPGVTLMPIRSDVNAVCMGFGSEVFALKVVHGDDPLLNAHVAAADKLPQGDGWRFMRKGAKPVNAAYAAAGAVHLARTLEDNLITGFFL